MELRAFLPFSLALATACTGACASAHSRSEPAEPVTWPVGTFLASAQIQYTARAVRPGSSARRLVQAEVRIDAGGTMTLTSGEGSCQELDTGRAARRSFRCGETGFNFELDAGTIRGTATAPVTYWTQGYSRCAKWGKDESGRAICIRMDEQRDQERTTRATARLSVVSAG